MFLVVSFDYELSPKLIWGNQGTRSWMQTDLPRPSLFQLTIVFTMSLYFFAQIGNTNCLFSWFIHIIVLLFFIISIYPMRYPWLLVRNLISLSIEIICVSQRLTLVYFWLIICVVSLIDHAQVHCHNILTDNG